MSKGSRPCSGSEAKNGWARLCFNSWLFSFSNNVGCRIPDSLTELAGEDSSPPLLLGLENVRVTRCSRAHVLNSSGCWLLLQRKAGATSHIFNVVWPSLPVAHMVQLAPDIDPDSMLIISVMAVRAHPLCPLHSTSARVKLDKWMSDHDLKVNMSRKQAAGPEGRCLDYTVRFTNYLHIMIK